MTDPGSDPGADIAGLLHQALAQHQTGNITAAMAGYRAVLAQQPRQVDALHLLGVALEQGGDAEAAVAMIRQAIAIDGSRADFHDNLGNALLAAKDGEGAAMAYREALRLEPQRPGTLYNLGNILRLRGETEEARQLLQQALRLQPRYADALKNLALLEWEEGDMAAAEPLFRQAAQLAPQDRVLPMNYALYQLARGAYGAGWDLYESRWRSGVYDERDWSAGLPRWDGSPQPGRHLLLWGEQGIGDQILHGTMLRDAVAHVRAAGACRVSIAVSDRLVPLLARSLADLPDLQVIERNQKTDADLQCPFGSLGRFLRRTATDFPAGRQAGAYLRADPARVAEFRARHAAMAGPGKRVYGLAWRSGNLQLADAKSIPLAKLAPLFALSGIAWLSVQYGDPRDEVAASGLPLNTALTVDGLQDIDGQAAQLAALDGIVSVSNTGVHVAAGLGLPCHLLLPKGRGRLWYWPREGTQSPWYGSVRLWRQHRSNIWEDVINDIASFLKVEIHS
ncbi:tetratricopeptide repeat protein [Ferrovibrio sp.]|uniref:tetratricopeptide repeat protein n=1 Tax=Ferrovibrio sp. TaxID=1917215 RepID=UPI0025B83A34|nr:tetratricopeptide repeat protein [Ferrovibrio sp.]MBX3454126.1 tetratricopeptide repeat protein [Ferrovibrio sp.]